MANPRLNEKKSGVTTEGHNFVDLSVYVESNNNSTVAEIQLSLFYGIYIFVFENKGCVENLKLMGGKILEYWQTIILVLL